MNFLVFLFAFMPVESSWSQFILPDDHSRHAEIVHEAENRGEAYFSFSLPGNVCLTRLSRVISIDKVEDGVVYAYVSASGLPYFLKKDIPYTLLDHPGDVFFELNMLSAREAGQKSLVGNWDFYPEYEAYVELMYRFEQEHPELVTIVKIGESELGRDLLFAKISPQVNTSRPVPRFMYTSTMHGDETAGFVLSLRLIHYLLTHYGTDAAITQLMDQVEIWICPNENPDGTYRRDNTTISGATRGNINGVDLNRNYPNPVQDPWHPMQAETAAMISFTDTMNFIMSANMHGGIELVNFPFDSWVSSENKHADHDWWEFVMNEYVDTVHAHSPPGYMTGMGTGVTHGGDWYVIYGSRQDYMNYYNSCREFTLELSKQKVLNPALLPDHWEYNYRSLINYIRQSTYGVHGLVYDNASGEPLHAEISLPGHDKDNSEISSTMPYGNYHRPLPEGTYSVRISHDDHTGLTIEGVEVINYHTTYLNIALGGDVGDQVAEVSISKEGKGSVTPFEGTQYFNHGANVFLRAEPAENMVFKHWEINGSIYHEPELVYATGNWDPDGGTGAGISIEAQFVPDTYTVSNKDLPGALVFPNPATDHFLVEFINDGDQPLKMSLLNIHGQTISKKTITDKGHHTVRFETGMLMQGIYLLRLESERNKGVPLLKKVVVR